MKTLVIQLARFGDIYQSWPSLLALEENEDEEIHLLVRERFRAATIGLPESIRIHVLPTKEVIEPVYNGEGIDPLKGLDEWLRMLAGHRFDRVINLSFSPFSSYLSSYLEMCGASVSGYTRHTDGFLNMHDDASAYFYAQVGVHKANRIHLTQMFSMICDVELTAAHLYPQGFGFSEKNFAINGDYFVLHVGASDLGKALSEKQLSDLIGAFLEVRSESLVLIGVSSEQGIAQAAKPRLGSERIFDLTGKTKIEELFAVINNSKGLIGCDSAPIHMASLLNKPILNLKNSWVNSFETGPFSEQFIVWDLEQDSEFSVDKLSQALKRICQQELIQQLPPASEIQNQQWAMLKALYLGGEYPVRIPKSTATNLTLLVERLPEVLSAVRKPQIPIHQERLRAFDQVLDQIEKSDPLIALVIRWFNAERIRIEPGSVDVVQSATLEALNRFFLILSDWVRVLGDKVEFIPEVEDISGHLQMMIKNFRFVNISPALESLEKFLPLLSDCFPTEVQEERVSRVKCDLEKALNKSDFERIADILEYDVLVWGSDQSQGSLPAT